MSPYALNKLIPARPIVNAPLQLDGVHRLHRVRLAIRRGIGVQHARKLRRRFRRRQDGQGVAAKLREKVQRRHDFGNAAVLATKWNSLFLPARTMTATIAAEMGEVANGSSHYHVLFLIGLILFLFSLAINVAASSVVFRQKKRAERILS